MNKSNVHELRRGSLDVKLETMRRLCRYGWYPEAVTVAKSDKTRRVAKEMRTILKVKLGTIKASDPEEWPYLPTLQEESALNQIQSISRRKAQKRPR